MKSIILMLMALYLSGCNNGKQDSLNEKPKVLKNDTTFCLGLYMALSPREPMYGEMRRVVWDSYDYVDADSVTKRKQWIRDTVYLVIQRLLVDSIVSRDYKIPIKDSLGKQNYTPPYVYPYKKEWVRSGWDNMDSASAELKRQKP